MEKDIAKKRLEEYNDVYADIFNVLLFGGEKVLEEEYLVSLPSQREFMTVRSWRLWSLWFYTGVMRNGWGRCICTICWNFRPILRIR